jgi:glucose/mannose-6-phosphate isomerase
MNLDDLSLYTQFPAQDILAEINSLPDQLRKAWEYGNSLPLPETKSISQVVIAGLGRSGLGGELVASYVEPFCKVPFFVHCDYGLPAWACGPETLVITSSYSGETEETISALEQALENGCTKLVITSGGKLAQAGHSSGATVWTYQNPSYLRSALAYSFALPLAALFKYRFVSDPSNEVDSAINAMRVQQTKLFPEVQAVHNPGKRYAGQLIGRWTVFLGTEFLAPVAKHWKMRVNEFAKAWAQFETLPKAGYYPEAGILAPEEVFSRTMTMFLNATAYHPRNILQSDETRRYFMLEGIPTDFYLAQGETRLAQQWTAIHFGDYIAFYLAIGYGVDPTPFP